MGLFRLILRDKNNLDRPLLYDPITSVMKWEDSGEELDISRLRIKPTTKSQESFHAAHQLSPDAPAGKSKSLILVKIQLGFRCNFSCQYCSQSTQRYDSPELIDIKKAQQFNEKLSSWYDGGSDGKGNGTRFEFWGGETLLYWRHIKIIAPYLREKYPNVVLRLFTNGSIMNDEIIDLAEKWQIQIVVSHDGPESAKVRGKDPFQDPHKKARLVAMYSRLGPKRLTSFNCTLTSSNYSLNKIRNYLAEQVGIQPHQVPLNHELSIPYQDDNFRFVWTDPKQAQLVRNEVFNELTARGPLGMNVAGVLQKVQGFFETLNDKKPARSVGQKCGMDRPDQLAIDLDGNILSCQNTTAEKGHKIGHIDDYENVRLDTSFHWSQRRECNNCPVLHLCHGSCMLLKEHVWEASCDQFFNWNLTILAVALYFLTDRTLVAIEGNPLRREEAPRRMIVIDL